MPKGVSVFLTRSEYENLIIQHGQFVYWKPTMPCPCTDSESESPNPDCKICAGRGHRYYDQNEFKIIHEELIMNRDEGKTLYGDILSVDKVYVDGMNAECFYGNQIIFDQVPANKGQKVYVDYTYTNKVKATAVQGVYRGNGIVEFPTLTFTTKHGLICAYDIMSATDITNDTQASDEVIYADGYKNFINIDTTYAGNITEVGDVITATVEYVKPQLMHIVGITPKMRYENSFILEQADAQLTVPNHLNISKGDVFTLALSEQPFSLVKSFHDEVDELAHYDVSRIEKVITEEGVDLINGTDFILIGRDKIKWLNSELLLGSYSMRYMYRTMFQALQDMPSIRYGENQPLPRRINLRSFNRLTTEEVQNI